MSSSNTSTTRSGRQSDRRRGGRVSGLSSNARSIIAAQEMLQDSPGTLATSQSNSECQSQGNVTPAGAGPSCDHCTTNGWQCDAFTAELCANCMMFGVSCSRSSANAGQLRNGPPRILRSPHQQLLSANTPARRGPVIPCSMANAEIAVPEDGDMIQITSSTDPHAVNRASCYRAFLNEAATPGGANFRSGVDFPREARLLLGLGADLADVLGVDLLGSQMDDLYEHEADR